MKEKEAVIISDDTIKSYLKLTVFTTGLLGIGAILEECKNHTEAKSIFVAPISEEVVKAGIGLLISLGVVGFILLLSFCYLKRGKPNFIKHYLPISYPHFFWILFGLWIFALWFGVDEVFDNIDLYKKGELEGMTPWISLHVFSHVSYSWAILVLTMIIYKPENKTSSFMGMALGYIFAMSIHLVHNLMVALYKAKSVIDRHKISKEFWDLSPDFKENLETFSNIYTITLFLCILICICFVIHQREMDFRRESERFDTEESNIDSEQSG